jgi:catechol 2,3-dioxygenase-like lactoylglutathione lyase family enzyme
MHISQVILRVGDLDRSVSFWSEAVGLPVAMKTENFAFLDGGGTQLALNQVEGVAADDSLTEIVLEFDDVPAAFDQLSERGVPFEVGLRPVTSDGTRELLAAHFRDPDGHLASVVGWVS